MLHITAPKQHLYVPDASWAFKLSFHSHPNCHSQCSGVVLVCHLVRSQSCAMAVFDFSACWLIRQLQILLAQSLASNGDCQWASFPCFLSSFLSYPLTECVPLCLNFKWKSQVRLTDGQCDHVTGGQKHCTTQYKRESKGDLAVGKFCFALLS